MVELQIRLQINGHRCDGRAYESSKKNRKNSGPQFLQDKQPKNSIAGIKTNAVFNEDIIGFQLNKVSAENALLGKS